MAQQRCPICKQVAGSKEEIKHKKNCSEFKYQQSQKAVGQGSTSCNDTTRE